MGNKQVIYDAVIVGGGMVGAAAALGLAKAGWHVAVIEHKQAQPFVSDAPPDLRISAIGYKSVNLLKQLGAWQAIESMRVVPYRGLETWEWPESKVVFTANSLNISELGYMVENHVLQLGLWQQFSKYSSLDVLCPAQLETMAKTSNGWSVKLSDGQQIETSLIVGADGAESQVRKLSGIGITGWQYRQSCMLIRVKTEHAQQDVTWQQFYPSGPRAFLPLFDSWASLVWYDSVARIRQLQNLSFPELTNEIKCHFPDRLGNVEVTGAASFPLIRRHAQRYVKQGLVLLGDAAHTINPLAGQGVNLGYRDVETLLKVLITARDKGEEWASEKVLKRYQFERYPDNLLMQTGMDVFYATFSNQLLPVKVVRNVALMAAQRSGKLKDWLLKYAIGA